MKNRLKKIVLNFLTALARIRLRRLRPFLIGVTGSIGKTSTKEAIYAVLKSKFRIFRSDKSYNTEFGLPLAILEQKSGFSSPLKWAKTLGGAFFKAFFGGGHMQMIILEMGADKPGDMSELLKLARPQVGVITNIKPVHLEEGQFKDLDDIFQEKSRLVSTLQEKGIAVLNADDPYLIGLKNTLSCRKIFYGKSDAADLKLLRLESYPEGIKFTVAYKDQVAEGQLAILGDFQIYVALAAIAVALTQGFELEEAVTALKDYKLPPGRMNPIEGINDSLIIDSSYNASPESVKEGLDILKTFEGRRIAVLGNMNELGTITEAKHREIGAYALGRADLLLLVGDNAKLIGAEALKSRFSKEAIFYFDDAVAAGNHLIKMIKNGDTILVKGSQNKVRLEKLVKMAMKDPARAKELLVRQDEAWLNI
jgi:UDP-N-acetylmuramoyl-tripeptide--D-alanyl-D-alanine ligase